MGKNVKLSEIEKGKILAFKAQNLSKREISRKINRSVCVITNFLNSPDSYGKKYQGRKKIFDDRLRRRLRNSASNKKITVKNLQRSLQTTASNSTIKRELKELNIKFKKMKVQPRFKKEHLLKRLEFARDNMATDWSRVWFSDEKKWNLDGPDGYNYYWHDLRKDKMFFQKQSSGGRGVMIWGAVSVKGKTTLCFFNSRVNSEVYKNNLSTNLIPFYDQHDIFQHDNAPCHSSVATREWLQQQNVTVLKWPSLSPD